MLCPSPPNPLRNLQGLVVSPFGLLCMVAVWPVPHSRPTVWGPKGGQEATGTILGGSELALKLQSRMGVRRSTPPVTWQTGVRVMEGRARGHPWCPAVLRPIICEPWRARLNLGLAWQKSTTTWHVARQQPSYPGAPFLPQQSNHTGGTPSPTPSC